jgi:hypothetical protein
MLLDRGWRKDDGHNRAKRIQRQGNYRIRQEQELIAAPHAESNSCASFTQPNRDTTGRRPADSSRVICPVPYSAASFDNVQAESLLADSCTGDQHQVQRLCSERCLHTLTVRVRRVPFSPQSYRTDQDPKRAPEGRRVAALSWRRWAQPSFAEADQSSSPAPVWERRRIMDNPMRLTGS